MDIICNTLPPAYTVQTLLNFSLLFGIGRILYKYNFLLYFPIRPGFSLCPCHKLQFCCCNIRNYNIRVSFLADFLQKLEYGGSVIGGGLYTDMSFHVVIICFRPCLLRQYSLFFRPHSSPGSLMNLLWNASSILLSALSNHASFSSYHTSLNSISAPAMFFHQS